MCSAAGHGKKRKPDEYWVVELLRAFCGLWFWLSDGPPGSRRCVLVGLLWQPRTELQAHGDGLAVLAGVPVPADNQNPTGQGPDTRLSPALL